MPVGVELSLRLFVYCIVREKFAHCEWPPSQARATATGSAGSKLRSARNLCTLVGICASARRAQTDRMLHAPRVNNTAEKPSARRNREAKMTPTKIAAGGPLSQQHDT